jgi:hypothetical protein
MESVSLRVADILLSPYMNLGERAFDLFSYAFCLRMKYPELNNILPPVRFSH